MFSETCAVILLPCIHTWWRSRFVETAVSRRRNRISAVADLDAKLLKYLRGLDKPRCFDGNNAEHQDFRFSFRIGVSLVSVVSQTLMDKREIKRNPISEVVVKALRDAHLKCSRCNNHWLE